MAAASSNSGRFVFESGDWPCQQCHEINFKSRNVCRRCSTPRNQPAQVNSTAAGIAPQSTSKPGDWICQSCSILNFAARTACYKCGLQKQVSTVSHSSPPVVSKPGDWKCKCSEINFGSRTVCRSCGTAKPSADNTKTSNECVICMEKPIDSVVTTCGHSAMCLECGAQVTSCPICRNIFNQQQIIKLFKVHE
ncbi:unnamed protein product [Rotaria socialis]|uniref:Uncharacterized protein n=1 Tax=Rotaria socialis TaxID=392032 RepID=A0A821B837_9BILA|nr:unnamed protein product [Rotaria socialis]CAF4591651.1 unnamed protein product [Rotaria socialis]